MTDPAFDFQVRRDDLHQVRWVDSPEPDPGALAPGQVLLAIDRFAFTANNVTYAAFGEEMGYWRFFPAAEPWGRIPVWGFADVVAASAGGIEPGERVFGFFPISTHLTVTADRVTDGGFRDASAHRRPLPGVYNHYVRAAGDPGYLKADEDLQALLRPLFMTSFLLADFLTDNDRFASTQVLISSASSKTAFGLAHLLDRAGGGELIGLTSAANTAFVAGLGCYDRVVGYDRLDELTGDTPALFVDVAGNAELRAAIHRRYADNLKYSCLLGAAHWDRRGDPGRLPGPRPEFFFAPTRLEERTRDWGSDGLQARYADAWGGFARLVRERLRIEQGCGRAEIERVYRATLDGNAAPGTGHVLTF